MKLHKLSLKHPKPDAKKFIDILIGRAKQDRTPLVEYLVDEVLMKPIVTELLGRTWIDYSGDRDAQKGYLNNYIEFWYRMGYDFVRFEQGLDFPRQQLFTADTAINSTRQRGWAEEHQGSITTWEEFERYPWPKVAEFDFYSFEYINSHLPEGMGLMTCHAGGIFEHLSTLMSYEGLCLALSDNPELVKAIAKKTSELMEGFYRHLLDLNNVIAIFPGDDMGFRSSTLISPNDLRKYCLSWHKRFADMAHHRGVPYFLHSCGNLETIMNDLIDDIGIDGKHSFEDAIIPVQEFQKKYGNRIAVLGGLDVDILASSTPEQVRQKTRELIETCGTRGRYALGSGNSIPSYIPIDNYLAMIDEALNNS